MGEHNLVQAELCKNNYIAVYYQHTMYQGDLCMDCSSKWNVFTHTGKVEDYLYYKRETENRENKWNDNINGNDNSNRNSNFINADK